MLEILQKLEPKDVVTLCVGTVALFVSIGSFLHSVTTKSREARRSAQDLFDSTVLGLVEIRKEREDYRLEHGSEWVGHKFGTLRVALNDRRELLLSQARSLLKNYNLKVSDISYVILGAVLMETGRAGEAVPFYKKAVELAVTPIEKAWHKRPYGTALLKAGKLREGRQQILASIAELRSLRDQPEFDGDNLQADMADAYRRLIWAELVAGYREHITEDMVNLEEVISKIGRLDSRSANEEALTDLKRAVDEKGKA